MTRVLVGASSAVARAGLESLVSAHPALELAGNSSDLATLAEQMEELRPDVLLVQLEPHDEPSSANRLTQGSNTAVVVLADGPGEGWAIEALRSGVRAVLPREATAAEITAAIEAAAAGLVALRPEAIDGWLVGPAPRPQPPRDGPSQTLYEELTPRELEVLRMLADGLGNKEIAWRLKISEHTVKFHISSIFGKLNTSTRTEAVMVGIRLGLIML